MTDLSPFNFLAYIAEHNPCLVESDPNGKWYHITDDNAFASAVNYFNGDVRTEVFQHKWEENETGMIFVKTEDIKFYVIYNDVSEKGIVFYLLNR